MTFKQLTLFPGRPKLPQIEPKPIRKALKPFMWEDNNEWIAETKIDGARFLMFVGDTENRFSSRHKSIKDGLFVERTDNMPHLRELELSSLSGTVLDGELTIGNANSSVMDVMSVVGALPSHAITHQLRYGWINYVAFDILWYNKINVQGEPYERRRYLLSQIIEDIKKQTTNISMVTCVSRNKKEFYESVISNGGEGVVLKNKNSVYGEDWVKAKKTSSYDVVIMGFEDACEMTIKVSGITSMSRLSANGWIGSIKFGQYVDGTLTELGSCSGMDDKTRQMFSDDPKAFINQVMEIKAQNQNESGSFRHPVFVKLRPDKNPEDCIMYPEES